ncbi:MAG: hypothetical protein WC744_02695 [Patescibacteria group bacterium]|jgi:hypothetical protein
MKKGQILLITVMLLATVMTIVLSVSFKSVTDTQVTKLEEESQKALAAAESAIEVALKNNANVLLSSISGLSGFAGSAQINSTAATTFTTPSIGKDGSYTFYLGNYNVQTKAIDPSVNQNIVICFQSGTPSPAIEVTLVKSTGVTGSVKKYVVDPNNPKRISNALGGNPSCAPDTANYSYSATIPSADISLGGNDGKFLLVRVLYAPTKLLFSAAGNLAIQGRTITSQATSTTSTGVSKKVVLFQSYPQIPGEFFSTAF